MEWLSGLIFYVFAFLSVFAAIMVISAKNPVHSVLWLILVFFNAAGIFVLLGAEFIAMSLIIVYVGAVAVLFLFVVMMLNINYVERGQGFHKLLPIGLLIALVLCIDLYLVFSQSIGTENSIMSKTMYPILDPKNVDNVHNIGLILYTDYFLPFQVSGLILLISMIGSIVLTHRHRKNVKKQDISKQLARTRSSSIKLVDIKPGEGI